MVYVHPFPVAAAPGSGPAGCSVWVIPENGETIRTDDGGAHWAPIAEGLPRIQSVEVALLS